MRRIAFLIILIKITIFAMAQCPPPSAQASLAVNNVRANLVNGGDLWFSSMSQPGYVFPASGTVSAIFTGGLWLAARDQQDSLRLAAMTYRNQGHDFYPGPIVSVGGSPQAVCSGFDRFWRTSRADIQAFLDVVESGVPVDVLDIPASVLDWPGVGNPHLSPLTIDEELAPFIDLNGDGIYDPVDGDHPDIKGDEALFWVVNDLGGPHQRTGGEPLGVEVRCMAYAWSSPLPAIDNSTFYDITISNEGGDDLDDVLVGLFVDVDLGTFNDDLIGCDTSTHSGYVYNGSAIDGEYGVDPPIVAMSFLNRAMGSFVYFNNAAAGPQTDPDTPEEFLNYMQSRWRDGLPIEFGGDGRLEGTFSTSYTYPSNPAFPPGPGVWSEVSAGNVPDDRRFLMCTEPNTLADGEVLSLQLVLAGQETNGHSGAPDVDSTLAPTLDTIRDMYIDSLSAGNTYAFTPPPLDTTSVRTAETRQAVLWPNPARERLHLTFFEEVNGAVSILDVRGRTHRRFPVSGMKAVLPVSDLGPGIYILELDNGRHHRIGRFVR